MSMAALRGNAPFLACAGAALLCNSGIAAYAQDAPKGDRQQSRIYPHEPKDGPPAITVVPTPPPVVATRPAERSLEEKLGDPVTTAELVEGTRLCMATVSPQFEVNPHVLADDGWGYTSPRREHDGQRSFEFVQYVKDDRTIALLDYGSIVICRVVGRVANADEVGPLRASLIEAFDAVPITDLPKLEAVMARLRRNSPQVDLANVLVTGDYSFEIEEGERDLGELATPSIRSFHALMVTLVPLPQEYRSPAPVSAAQ